MSLGSSQVPVDRPIGIPAGASTCGFESSMGTDPGGSGC